jgi:hypothetical protein
MNFDLNIENYSKDELREMFGLPIIYNEQLINTKEIILKNHLINNNNMDKELLNKTINFIVKAKNILLINPSSESSKDNINDKLFDEIYNVNSKLKESNLTIVGDHMIEDRQKIPFLESFPGQYFPGVINPLKKRVRMMNLNIDSKFRDNYYSTLSTNFNFQLNQNISHVVQMQLATIEVPTTIFVISKQYDNNFFYIDLPDTNVSELIEIPEGNYDLRGLQYALNNKLSIIGAPYSNIVFKVSITDGENGTGQMLVGLSSGTGSYNLNFQKDRSGINNESFPLMLKLGWIMGFRNGLYTNNLNYISEGIIDLIGPKYYYLVIDDYTTSVNNNFYAEFNQSLLNKNILDRLSLNGGMNNKYPLINITKQPRDYYGPVTITNFTVQLLDSFGRIVDLNNMDFSFCLNLTLEYDI